MTLLKTQYVQFTNEEIEMLSTLMRSSSDVYGGSRWKS